MGLPIPDLDDKTFNTIVEEARSLISRFAPEWTDHNVHDPGITFIELFAWLAEMQIYQTNRVTDKSYEKFLNLVGLYPADAQPAKVDITFRDVTDEKFIERGTQLTTNVAGEDITFEVEEDFILYPLVLISVDTIYDSQKKENREANKKDGIYFHAFGERAAEGSILELEFDKPFPEGKDISVTFILFEEDLPSEGSHADESVQVIRSVNLVWEYLDDENWIELTPVKDTTASLSKSGKITFTGPSSLKRKNNPFKIRCRLNSGQYEIPPKINMILLNTISAIQIETINEELGMGLEIPGQQLYLKKTPVINENTADFPNSLFNLRDVLNWNGLFQQLKEYGESVKPNPVKPIWNSLDQGVRTFAGEWKKIRKADKTKYDQQFTTSSQIIFDALNKALESGYPYQINFIKKIIGKNRILIQVQNEDWYEVDDFELSDQNATHYTFDLKRKEITFGNGLNGRIPAESKIIRASYKSTLGVKGNIPKGQKFGFEGIVGKNLREAAGGKEAESIEHAKVRAKKDFREQYRAITSEDYELLAISTPGLRVARAKAIPCYNPDFPCVSIPDAVTIVVVPETRERANNFRLTSQSFAGLKKEKIPPDILVQISSLKDQEYINEEKFVNALQATLGKNSLVNYKPQILKHAKETYLRVPTEGFIQTISGHLNMHRLITTDVHVIGPEYVKVSVSCKIYLMKRSSPGEVEKRVRKKLENFLDPLKGGPDGKGWQFGRSVFPSEVYQIVDKVEGVNYVTEVSLDAEGKFRKDKEGKIIRIPSVALVYSGEHQLEIIQE